LWNRSFHRNAPHFPDDRKKKKEKKKGKRLIWYYDLPMRRRAERRAREGRNNARLIMFPHFLSEKERKGEGGGKGEGNAKLSALTTNIFGGGRVLGTLKKRGGKKKALEGCPEF